jgi:hypothetical protein
MLCSHPQQALLILFIELEWLWLVPGGRRMHLHSHFVQQIATEQAVWLSRQGTEMVPLSSKPVCFVLSGSHFSGSHCQSHTIELLLVSPRDVYTTPGWELCWIGRCV